ncbi:hypothetical protein RB213_012210, partial [Colletotrichum asianum]
MAICTPLPHRDHISKGPLDIVPFCASCQSRLCSETSDLWFLTLILRQLCFSAAAKKESRGRTEVASDFFVYSATNRPKERRIRQDAAVSSQLRRRKKFQAIHINQQFNGGDCWLMHAAANERQPAYCLLQTKRTITPAIPVPAPERTCPPWRRVIAGCSLPEI